MILTLCDTDNSCCVLYCYDTRAVCYRYHWDCYDTHADTHGIIFFHDTDTYYYDTHTVMNEYHSNEPTH